MVKRVTSTVRNLPLLCLWYELAVCTLSHTDPATARAFSPGPAPEQRGLWTDAEDNAHLPQGERLAVLISGLSKRGAEFDIFENVLHSVHANVVEALGEDLVDVYLHIEAAPDSNQTAAQLAGLIASLLPERIVRGSILQGSATGGGPPPPLHSGLAAGGWKHKAYIVHQFARVQELYALALLHERRSQQKYGYIARLRSDCVLFTPWLSPLTEWKKSVPANTVAGPGYHIQGHRQDKMYLAPRSSSWRVMMELPTFFYMKLSPDDAWLEIGCDYRGPLDDYIMGTCDRWGCPRGGGARGCEFCCGNLQDGIGSPLMCPEVVLPVAFRRMGLTLVDSCPVTGHYALLGRAHPFEHHCAALPPLPDTLSALHPHHNTYEETIAEGPMGGGGGGGA